jgi:hypothetical protein
MPKAFIFTGTVRACVRAPVMEEGSQVAEDMRCVVPSGDSEVWSQCYVFSHERELVYATLPTLNYICYCPTRVAGISVA